jgi:hypothetical protein
LPAKNGPYFPGSSPKNSPLASISPVPLLLSHKSRKNVQ